ncbi:TIGR04104 family putative zinc finger protein [Salinibacillus kushneri]|uniref:TIGR04104 family putative zinc finger protein n=1 Tax=Salinibacillus kushneri TaxID=237682 RepID=UPI000B82C247
MPICQNCGYCWRWKEAFRKNFTLDIALNCPSCGEKQYPSSKTRKKASLFTILLPFPLLLNIFLPFSPFVLFTLLFGMPVILLFYYPFFMELRNEEKPFGR